MYEEIVRRIGRLKLRININEYKMHLNFSGNGQQ